MTLADVIRQIDQLDDWHSIYATPRWRAGSRALVAPEPRDGSLPEGAEGMTYLTRVGLARRAIEARTAWGSDQKPSLDDHCGAVIYWAVYDAPEPRPLPADAEAELAIAI